MSFEVAVLVGSLRRQSFNRQLADASISVAPDNLTMHLVGIGDIPVYNQDVEDKGLPESVVRFKSEISQTDAVLIVTPEYNRSIPAVLKNAIDWGSRPDLGNVWSDKPVGIIGASTGQFGTINAQFDLRKVLVHTNSLVMPQPQVLVTNVEKKLTTGQFDDKTTVKIQEYLAAFERWIERMSG